MLSTKDTNHITKERDYYSFSSLRKYVNCPVEYELTYELSLRDFSSSEYSIYGSTVHEALDMFFKAGMVEEPKTYYKQAFQQVKTETVIKDSLSRKLMSDLLSNGNIILDSFVDFLDDYFSYDWEIVESEREIYSEIDFVDSTDRKFKGYIDLIVKHGDYYYIIDYKTTNKEWGRWKKEDKKYYLQLQVYKYFYSKESGIPLDKIKTLFVFFTRLENDKIIPWLTDSGDTIIEEMKNYLSENIRAIESKRFYKNLSSCMFCSYRGKECSGAKKKTKDNIR